MEPRRGSLRVYLGASPGVGKTFAMLNEGRRRVERGTDVVVGVVETHGRAQTAAQLQGLEVVPRRAIEYRGTTLLEMDLDCRPGPPTGRGARRRVRAHQHPGVQARQALAGRRGDARRRHRRDHHRQRPAPRVAQRRRQPDHRHDPARDDPGRRRAPRRPDRADRHVTGGDPPAHGPRQHLRGREDRRRDGQLLPPRQPRSAPRAGTALGGRSRRRGAARLPPDPGHLRPLGDARARRRRAHRRRRRRVR